MIAREASRQHLLISLKVNLGGGGGIRTREADEGRRLSRSVE